MIFKEECGCFFFFFCYFTFLIQILLVAYIEDKYQYLDEYNQKIDYQNPILLIHKIIIYFLIFLSFISQIRTTITDPGFISYKNNLNIIKFYYYLHGPFIERAKAITEIQTEEKIRKIIFTANNIKYDENEEYCLDNDEDFVNNSDNDEMKFKPRTSISEELKKEFIINYRFKITRCKNCYVARPSHVHHCALCHACVLEQDHHCPWVNNCIGLFNKKYFILFILYGFLSTLYSAIIFCYYSIFKHKNFFFDNILYIYGTIICVIVEVIYGIFTVVLLFEQYDNIKNDRNVIDFRNGFLLEKSTFMQQLIIIFGSEFSLKWFFPFFSGCYYDFFVKMCKPKYKNKIDKTKKEKID